MSNQKGTFTLVATTGFSLWLFVSLMVVGSLGFGFKVWIGVVLVSYFLVLYLIAKIDGSDMAIKVFFWTIALLLLFLATDLSKRVKKASR